MTKKIRTVFGYNDLGEKCNLKNDRKDSLQHLRKYPYLDKGLDLINSGQKISDVFKVRYIHKQPYKYPIVEISYRKNGFEVFQDI